jgi:hypothetical protein
MERKGMQSGFLLGKSKGKRPEERPRYRWDSNIEMDFREIR